jgi:hypothetical protein
MNDETISLETEEEQRKNFLRECNMIKKSNTNQVKLRVKQKKMAGVYKHRLSWIKKKERRNQEKKEELKKQRKERIAQANLKKRERTIEYNSRPKVMAQKKKKMAIYRKKYYSKPRIKKRLKEKDKERRNMIAYARTERELFLKNHPEELEHLREEIMTELNKN